MRLWAANGRTIWPAKLIIDSVGTIHPLTHPEDASLRAAEAGNRTRAAEAEAERGRYKEKMVSFFFLSFISL